MGRKRKNHDTEEEVILEKIRKLQEKLQKKRRRRILSSSSEENSESNEPITVEADIHASSRLSPHEAPYISPDSIPDMISPLPPTPPISYNAPPGVETLPALQPPDERDVMPEVPLDEITLKLLGDAPKPDHKFGKNIHKDLANRWQDILSKGLSKEAKEQITSEYLIPANCHLLAAPLLNPEAKAALADLFVKCDMALLEKQKNIGIVLSALSQAINVILLSGHVTGAEILKPLSDACRILCDCHYGETKLRRNFVISSVNSKLKDALVDSTRDEYLFGSNLSEKLKAVKSIQQSGDALKQKFNRNNFIAKTNNTSRNSLNIRGLHREQRAPNRNDAGRARGVPRYPPPPLPARQQPPMPPRARRGLSPPPPPARRVNQQRRY